MRYYKQIPVWLSFALLGTLLATCGESVDLPDGSQDYQTGDADADGDGDSDGFGF